MIEMLLLVGGARRGRGVLTGGIKEDLNAVGQRDNKNFCCHGIAPKASCKCQQHADNVTNTSAFACFAEMSSKASN